MPYFSDKVKKRGSWFPPLIQFIHCFYPNKALTAACLSQITIMDQAEFCSYCSKICFEALRSPYTYEIEDLLSGKFTGLLLSGAKAGETISKVSLGTLSRIKRDSATCELCALFHHIISRQGCVYNGDQTLNAENIVFRADPDVSYYGYISDRRKQGGTTWIPRRLSLMAHFVDDQQGTAIAYFDHVLQACEVDVGLSTAGGIDDHLCDGRRGQGMEFGGRRKPYVVDIELLKSWIRICQDEHGSSCTLTSSQEEHAQ